MIDEPPYACMGCSSHDEVVTGDMHTGYDPTSGMLHSYVYDGAGWMSVGIAPYTTTTTASGAGVYSSWTTGATLTGTKGYTTDDLTLFDFDVEESDYDILYPEKDDPEAFPTRLQFVARTLRKHTVVKKNILNPITNKYRYYVRCTCENVPLDLTLWELHLAEVAIKAADEWDELLMGPDMEDEG